MTSEVVISMVQIWKLRGRRTGRRASQLLGDVAQIDNDSLDAIALALNLGLQALHLVAVEGIGDIPADIEVGHGDGVVGDGLAEEAGGGVSGMGMARAGGSRQRHAVNAGLWGINFDG